VATTVPTVRWGATTDVGRTRRVNEDSVLATGVVFAVADGMGGHAAGEVASSLAVDTVRTSLAASPPPLEAAVAAVAAANRAVFGRAVDEPHLRGMGTTLCGLVLADDGRVVIVNVGDSRAYVLRGGALVQISRDHSYVEELVAAGALTRAEARTHPHRNIVTRALGIEPEVHVDAWQVEPLVGDRFLLCSDGLYGEVDDDVIAQVLAGLDDQQAVADKLVVLANDAGGRDNISVVIVDVVDARTAATLRDAAPTEPAAPVPADTLARASAPPRPKRRRRAPRPSSVLFAFAVVAVLAGAVAAVQYFGRQGYYVTFGDTGRIEAYQGRSGGLLWVQPSRVRIFELSRSDLVPAWQDRIDGEITFTDRAAVDAWYEALSRNPAAQAATTATTTTTTTTTATTTTTTTTAVAPAPTEATTTTVAGP